MKNIGWLITSIILAVCLVSAIVLWQLSVGKLNDTKINLASTQSKLELTQSNLQTTQDNLAATKSELNSTQSQLKQTSDNLTSTLDSLKKTQNELVSTQSELSDTQSKLTTTQNNLTDVSSQLDAIKKVYPLKRFTDLDTLTTWLSAQPITSLTAANTVALQEAGAKDGWLISAGFWVTSSGIYEWDEVVLANGDSYFFRCSDHTIRPDFNINTFYPSGSN